MMHVPRLEARDLHGHVRSPSFAVPGHRMLYIRFHELGEQQAVMVNTYGRHHASVRLGCELLQFQAPRVNHMSILLRHESVLSSQGLACVISCRSILLLALAHMMQNFWMIEQPGSSLLNLTVRFQWLLREYARWSILAAWI